MNNVRRKKLTEIYDKLEAIKSELEEVLDEEDTALDGVSENFVNRREQMEETIGALEDTKVLYCLSKREKYLLKISFGYMAS